ncbi:DUF2291 family protein [Amaricoccus solimangrovi]|uniref:DUF2291 domain-containing protein n=1 Tax=Amaricoccus solimangrovi TaxID=2589815 RepID=A0A501WDL8_9RHOB|nr:DUF2291 domain-containing protein [Amaricoccus solimangrovi]TPE47983.1 DUF2291 domain-containing protein [Amaricoccus solimangrovi]
MFRFPLTLVCAALLLAPSGCKIVKTPAAGETAAGDATGDAARAETRVAETYDAKLVPFITERAVPVADLRAALAGGLDTAGAAHGTRGSGAGAAWTFPVKGEGKVVEAALDTRARTLGIDTDGDGAADATLQLGPVIKGTALRDVAPFYNFDDFRDQIEFAKLARGLNDRATAAIALPEGDPKGRTVAFLGAVALRSATEPMLVTPVSLEVRP